MELPEGLTVGLIERWKRKDVVAGPLHWSWVMDAYKSLPDLMNQNSKKLYDFFIYMLYHHTMRKIALGFLTLLMLTPVLACTMAVCPMKSAQAVETMPCHETQDSSFMFALDCMEVDLFKNNLDQEISHDQSFDKLDYGWINLTSNYDYLSREPLYIRGPPLKNIRPTKELSPLHSTQRFRI